MSELVELATDVRSEEPVEPVSLGEVADDVAARFRRRTGTEIVVDADGAGTVDGRRAMLDRAVSNLVDNAVKFSADGEAVTVSVHGGTLEVADRGPGIAAEDRDRVFDRFYRAAERAHAAGLRPRAVDRRADRRAPRGLGRARRPRGRWHRRPPHPSHGLSPRSEPTV